MLRKTAVGLGLIVSVGGALLAAPVLADTITFKNGHEVNGRLIEETADYVIFQVGNGKLRFSKKEIATFTEDADYGQKYFAPPKRAADEPDVIAGTDGGPSRTWYEPKDATPQEKKDLRAVHLRIDEELKKLPPSSAERLRRLDLSSAERAQLDSAIAGLGKGGRSSSADFSAFGPKAIQALADVISSGDAAARTEAANALSDAVRRGDPGDVKWALGRSKVGTRLLTLLDSQGDDSSAGARNAGNQALESISQTTFNWQETKDPIPTDSQRTAIGKWRDWATKDAAAFDASEKANDEARRKLDDAWRSLDDSRNWRKALAAAIDAYGTTLDKNATKPEKGTDTNGAPLNPDIAKDASPEEQKALAEMKQKIKTCLEKTVGPSIEELKKKYEPTSEERQELDIALHALQSDQRRGGNDKRQNALATVTGLGIKAIGALSEALDGDNLLGRWDAAKALGGIATQGPDALALIREAGVPSKICSLLDESTEERAVQIRADANAALQAISGTTMGWPSDATDKNPSSAESDARGRWVAWAAKDAADFQKTERLREENRKALTDLLKKLEGPRTWRDAMEKAPAAIAKAERELKH
jgi:hypothetical protein